MTRFILSFSGIALILSAIGSVQAQNLSVFKDPRTAIAAAKNHNKLIVFFLANDREESHGKILSALKESLGRVDKEFILVESNASSRNDAALFSGRFKQDLSVMPIAVVSNASGEALDAHQGDKMRGYEKMLISARIKSGKITDPLELAALKERLRRPDDENGRSADSFLAPMLDDLKQKKVALTELREWKKKDGTSFKAHLIEALGTEGLFIDEKGDELKVSFNDFDPETIRYLQTILTAR